MVSNWLKNGTHKVEVLVTNCMGACSRMRGWPLGNFYVALWKWPDYHWLQNELICDKVTITLEYIALYSMYFSVIWLEISSLWSGRQFGSSLISYFTMQHRSVESYHGQPFILEQAVRQLAICLCLPALLDCNIGFVCEEQLVLVFLKWWYVNC